jgi:hypothetical protein
VRTVWTSRDIDAAAATAWQVLTDLEQWPEWGPSVRKARVRGGHLAPGATGTITTAVGVELGFEITTYEPGVRWAWKVAGIGATDHRVEPLGATRCRVGFGVPWPAAAYLAVCRVALHRIDVAARRLEANGMKDPT